MMPARPSTRRRNCSASTIRAGRHWPRWPKVAMPQASRCRGRCCIRASQLQFQRPQDGGADGNRAADFGDARKADLAASFQAAVIEVLVAKSIAALKRTGLKQLICGGRCRCQPRPAHGARRCDPAARSPCNRSLKYTDNGAMIALPVRCGSRPGQRGSAGRIAVRPRWPLAELTRP